MTTRKLLLLPLVAALTFVSVHAADKPKLTLDEFFNSMEVKTVKLCPDGHSMVIATVRADWDQSVFRKDLWLYRGEGPAGGSLTQLTQSGRDSDPQWSPDGRWNAFLSERKAAKGGNSCEEESKSAEVAQLYLISPAGGEALPVTQGDEKSTRSPGLPTTANFTSPLARPGPRGRKMLTRKTGKMSASIARPNEAT